MAIRKERRDMSTSERVTYCVTCSPCIAWSVLLRLVCCPISCMRYGPGGCCSNNECTDCVDDHFINVLEGKVTEYKNDEMCVPPPTARIDPI